MKPHTEITFETEETLVLREGSKVAVDHCFACGRDSLMATPRAAAFLAGISERQIFRLIESELLHFRETDYVLICLESVRALGKEMKL